ncbi:hypothetical protein SAY86_006411 [Trapa natans]|uniref:Kinesin motor domain-containing protein n=1 Tax=Trapa natans TaxID=22666 RepID=A0AAN7L9Q1_TRANT|nr:hypothetical protein SAY86_006411 [Trapa natans]
MTNEAADWKCINDTTMATISGKGLYFHLPILLTEYSVVTALRGKCMRKEPSKLLSQLLAVLTQVFLLMDKQAVERHTMDGITEQTHEERAFILKFSAIEIYNEAIRDLLSSDNTPLKLRDDPERGTIVEKMTEETLRDWNHFNELVSICEGNQ